MITLNSYTVTREDVPIFRPVTLNVDEGEVVAIRGENGVGKSTLLRSIAGLHWPGHRPRGDIYIRGLTGESKLTERITKGLMLVIRQHPTCYDNMAVHEQLRVSGSGTQTFICAMKQRISGSKETVSNTLVLEALRRFDLENYLDSPVNVLSVGQLRRLSFCSAYLRLALDKLKILVLDEPLNGLDKKSQTKLLQFLGDASKSGCAIILSEHAEDPEISLGQRVVTLYNHDKHAPFA